MWFSSISFSLLFCLPLLDSTHWGFFSLCGTLQIYTAKHQDNTKNCNVKNCLLHHSILSGRVHKCWDGAPGHRRAPCEHWWVSYLVQGYCGSALKVIWRLPLLERLPCFLCSGALNRQTSAPQPRLSYYHPNVTICCVFFGQSTQVLQSRLKHRSPTTRPASSLGWSLVVAAAQCLPAAAAGRCVRLEGKMKAAMSRNILDNIAQGSPDLRLDQGFTFHRNNDLKHTAKIPAGSLGQLWKSPWEEQPDPRLELLWRDLKIIGSPLQTDGDWKNLHGPEWRLLLLPMVHQQSRKLWISMNTLCIVLYLCSILSSNYVIQKKQDMNSDPLLPFNSYFISIMNLTSTPFDSFEWQTSRVLHIYSA